MDTWLQEGADVLCRVRIATIGARGAGVAVVRIEVSGALGPVGFSLVPVAVEQLEPAMRGRVP